MQDYVREIANYNDDVLAEPVPIFDFEQRRQEEALEIIKTLQYNMQIHGGLGMAAPQIGIRERIMVIASKSFLAFFNPTVVGINKTTSSLEEESINYPGLKVKVKRPTGIRLRYQQSNGIKLTKKFSGITARIIQHHLHFLDGEDFFVDANRFHYEKAMKKWKRKK